MSTPVQAEMGAAASGSLEIRPLTPQLWPDLEALFGPRGAVGGCWCMWWRLPGRDFERASAEQKREQFRSIVEAGEAPGLLAYLDGRPVGWCAVAPRGVYGRLLRSRTLRHEEGPRVWAAPCLFIARGARRKGVSCALLRAAVDFANARGAASLEGYPVESTTGRIPDVFAHTGLPSAFRQAGFQEVARPSKSRVIMRAQLDARCDTK